MTFAGKLTEAIRARTFGQPLPAGRRCPDCGHRAHPDGCAETPDSECACETSTPIR